MAEFSADLHTRQEETYVTLRFLRLLWGSFTSFIMTIALAIPPVTVNNRGVRLFKRIQYLYFSAYLKSP